MSMANDIGRRRIEVLVVDDSAVVRQSIPTLLRTFHDIAVRAAANPLIAMERMRQQRPDVIILDLEMPGMDGMTFLRKIMREDPLPVIVCSGLVGNRSDAAVRALEEGAVDLIAKPQIGLKTFLDDSAVMLADAIRAAAMVDLPRLRVSARPRHAADVIISPAGGRPTRRNGHRLIAIGASTGGPEALHQILAALPPTVPGIVVVQHMPEVFTASFARRLDEVCAISVKEAESGDEIIPGRALIARGNHHLVIDPRGDRLFVDVISGPIVSLHRPSVDVLFRSAAQAAGSETIGILLTGMGNDGAAGLLELRQSGAWTIAQNEQTCAVFGMPREAIGRGAAVDVMPVTAIAPSLLNIVSAQPALPKLRP